MPEDSSNAGGAPQNLAFTASPPLLAELVDLAEDAIISVGGDHRIILFNQGAERVFGYRSQEVIGKSLDILLPERMVTSHRKHLSDFTKSPLVARPMREREQILGRRKDGTEFPAEASISKVEAAGQTLLTVILRDVTERVAADHKLQDSLREKEALLREIHHRVKNNLQVMSSLLGLQSRTISNEQTRRAFAASQDRIHSMALLHEMLCRSGDLSRIDLAEYTRQLGAHLFRSYEADEQQIRLCTDLDRVYLNLDAAVPFGLITNELMSNALSHAFPGDRKGEVRVSLYEHKDQLVKLIVRDDGVGLPDETRWQSAGSLGFRLVRMLAEQLGAEIEIRPRDPTEIQVSFRPPE